MKIKIKKGQSIYESLKSQNYNKTEHALNKDKNSGIEIFNHYYENSCYAVKSNFNSDYNTILIDLNTMDGMLNFLDDVVKKEFKKNPLIGKLINEILQYNSKKLSHTTGLSILSRVLENKEFLTDRDNLRNFTNAGYDFGVMAKMLNDVFNNINLSRREELTGLLPPKNFEILHDDLTLILHNQKAKKIIQKIYGNKYKDLVVNKYGKIDEKFINTYRVFVENSISISEIKTNFAKKIARFKSAEEHSIALNRYMNSVMGWSKDLVLEKANKLGATIQGDKGDILCLKIHDYKQSKELGSGQWCLSYDEKYLKDYKGSENAIYFTFDFSLEQGNKKSMLGTVLDFECQIVNQHWRDDSIVEDWNEEDKYDVKKHEELFPEGFSENEKNENIFDSLNMKADKSDYTTSLLSRIREMKDLTLLKKGMESKLFDKEFNSSYTNYFSKMYGFTLPSNRDKPEDILEKKIFKQGIKNALESLISFHIPSYGDNFFNDLLINKEVDMINVLLKKSTKESDFLSIIANTVNYSEEESLSLIAELREIKNNRELPMFNEKELSKIIMSASFMEDHRMLRVAHKYVELNNGRIDISNQIDEYLRDRSTDEILIKLYDYNKDFLINVIDSVQKRELVKAKKTIQKHIKKIDKSDILYKKIQSKIPLINKVYNS